MASMCKSENKQLSGAGSVLTLNGFQRSKVTRLASRYFHLLSHLASPAFRIYKPDHGYLPIILLRMSMVLSWLVLLFFQGLSLIYYFLRVPSATHNYLSNILT